MRCSQPLGPRPQGLAAYRLFDVALVAVGLAALLALGLTAPFSRAEFYAYAMPLLWIPNTGAARRHGE